MKATYRNNRDGRRWVLLAACLVSAVAAAQGQAPAQGRGAGRGIQPSEHPVLPIGAPLPEFALPGVDGKVHKSSEYAKATVLAVLFESVHCPVSINYEARAEQLYNDYRNKGVALVAINPNNPNAIRLNELGYTDMTDSLPEMRIRTAFRGITWPYLYDGDTQATSMTFGAVATPHIFIFDRERKLRYQGSIDDNQRPSDVKTHYARDAIEAVLAGREVPIAETRAFGCSTKWIAKKTGVEEEMARIKAAPVKVDLIDADAVKGLRANVGTNKTVLVSFWSTGCALCASQFLDIENTYRMYRQRPFDFTTVSTDPPDKNADVVAFLRTQYAGGPNKQFASADTRVLQAAWGATWDPAAPFTAVIAPDGKVLYQKEGKIDILELRRIILSSIPDNQGYPGNQAYFQDAVARMRMMKKKK
jgi:peroxiredoxin